MAVKKNRRVNNTSGKGLAGERPAGKRPSGGEDLVGKKWRAKDLTGKNRRGKDQRGKDGSGNYRSPFIIPVYLSSISDLTRCREFRCINGVIFEKKNTNRRSSCSHSRPLFFSDHIQIEMEDNTG